VVLVLGLAAAERPGVAGVHGDVRALRRKRAGEHGVRVNLLRLECAELDHGVWGPAVLVRHGGGGAGVREHTELNWEDDNRGVADEYLEGVRRAVVRVVSRCEI